MMNRSTCFLVLPARPWFAASACLALGLAACDGAADPTDAGATIAPADSSGADGGGGVEGDADGGGEDGGRVSSECALDACGGDVVGTWDFETPCLPTRPAPVDDCGGRQHFFVTRVDGTFELRADGTDTVTTRLVQETHSYHPQRCIPGGGACESFFHGYDRCEVRDGFCDCELVTAPPLEPAEERYRVEGSTLVFVEADGTEQAVTFCVDGERLRYHHDGDRRPETLRRR